jgi:hypothetical protein
MEGDVLCTKLHQSAVIQRHIDYAVLKVQFTVSPKLIAALKRNNEDPRSSHRIKNQLCSFSDILISHHPSMHHPRKTAKSRASEHQNVERRLAEPHFKLNNNGASATILFARLRKKHSVLLRALPF